MIYRVLYICRGAGFLSTVYISFSACRWVTLRISQYVAVILSQEIQGVSMDSSHGLLALGGLFFGWWFTAKPAPQPEVRSEPSACHCVCSVKPEPCSSGADWQLLLGLGLLILVLAANLFLAFKVTLKQSDSGDREYSVSFKGRSGKGVFGASKGLQILDR